MPRDEDDYGFDWVPEWLPSTHRSTSSQHVDQAQSDRIPLEPLPSAIGTETTLDAPLGDIGRTPASLLSRDIEPTSDRFVPQHIDNDFLHPTRTRSVLPVASQTPSARTGDTPSAEDKHICGIAVRSGDVKTVIVLPNPDRTVKRELRGSHLFMITINATLGTGLYLKSGLILQLGGPLVLLVSLLSIGLLSWAVMQCITEMLCIWPVPGALSVYVSEFVDVELGIAAGITYWFTYSVSFAAIMAAAAGEVQFWTNQTVGDKIVNNKNVDIVMFLVVPAVLTMLNAFEVKIYGWIELVTGSMKIMFLFIIIIFLIFISATPSANPLSNSDSGPKPSYWDALTTSYDTNAVPNWGSALLLSLSAVAFSYVGVEIVAASALEVRWPKHMSRTLSDVSERSGGSSLIGKTVRWSSIWIPVLVCLAYTTSGILVSTNTPREDCSLPRFSWVPNAKKCPPLPSSSAFVIIAKDSKIPHLADVFNAFLVFTALTCAMTNLYVASRSMFGLASRLDRGTGQPLVLRMFAWFGKTNRHKVPMRAMIFSSLAFIWVPFLNLKGGDETVAITTFAEVLSNMGTAGVIIVWACECLAFLRFYYCIKRHQQALERERIPQVRRWNYSENDYPYRSHGQPFTAYMGLAGCLILLIVCNTAYMWGPKQNPAKPFLSSYPVVLVFLVIWVALKLFRGARWSLVDLSDSKRVIQKIKNLHDLRQGAM